MFLRFLCPAIVAPDAFGVVKTAPSSAVRRTLVLMSKVVQNLANGTEHAKEEYMQPTDVFVATNLSRIRTYFKHISDLSRVPLDKVDVNFTIIPVPLVEESLTIVHRMIIKVHHPPAFSLLWPSLRALNKEKWPDNACRTSTF